jgi:crotonobetainyl-CoA:carnitine CoA-transferase CaiB-like acyl-CoA transferase
LRRETTAHWVEVLNTKGVPSGEILSLEAALSSEQVKHREAIADVDVSGLGVVKLFNLAAKFSKTPGRIDAPPPRLSEHTQVILDELGYSAEERKVLAEKRVV